MKKKELILIIDDTLENIQVLGTILQQQGYRINVANSGLQGLKQIKKVVPDLILLDVMMPGLDGFEICARLKSNPQTQGVPVIFITAKRETEDIVKGFELGAVDYVTKPFNTAELLARVRTHLALKAGEKAMQVIQKEIARHRSVAEMVTGVAHELNTPLGIATYAANIISTSLDEETVAAIGTDADSRETLRDVVDASRLIQRNITRANTLIQRFKTISVEQLSDVLEEVNIVEKMEEIIRLCRIGSQLKIDLQVELPHKQRCWLGYPGYLFQVVQNLLTNVDQYAYKDGEQTRALVLLGIKKPPQNDEKVYFEVIVKDYGQGIPEQDLARIFDAFYTTGRAKGGSGLGLAIVDNLVCSAMAGTIEVASMVDQGTAFHITIPQTMAEGDTSRENQ